MRRAMWVDGALWILGAAVVALVAYGLLAGGRDRPPDA